MLVDYHMHLERGPFAPDWLDRFLAVAAERGVAEIGVSEHIYRFAAAQDAYGAWWEDAPPDPDPLPLAADGGPAAGTRAFAARWWTGRGGGTRAPALSSPGLSCRNGSGSARLGGVGHEAAISPAASPQPRPVGAPRHRERRAFLYVR